MFSLYEGISTVRLLEGMVFPEEEDGTVVFFVPIGSGANEFGILAEYVYEDSLFYGDFKRLKVNYNVAGVSADRSYPAVTTGKTGTTASVPTQGQTQLPTQAPTQAPTAAAPATAQATAAASQDPSGIYDLYERTDMVDVKTQYSFYYISLLKNGSYVEEAKTADGTVCGSNGTWSVSGDILSLKDTYGYTSQYKISGNTFASIGGDSGSPVFKFKKRF